MDIKDTIGQFYLIDGQLQPLASLAKLSISDERPVYEVIRVIEGVPLFLQDHVDRMHASLTMLGRVFPISSASMSAQIRLLAETEKMRNFNVKIILYLAGNTQRMLLYISRSHYPGQDQIDQGVAVSLLHRERTTPNAKIVDPNYKQLVSDTILRDQVFEVLLVNTSKEVTEGSRSNVFFLKGDQLYTAPQHQVLKGITRKYVLQVSKSVGIKVMEEAVKLEELTQMDGLFLSGTSLKVLPVARIEQATYGSSTLPSFLALRDGFDRLIETVL